MASGYTAGHPTLSRLHGERLIISFDVQDVR